MDHITTTATTAVGQLFEVAAAIQAEEVAKAALDPEFESLLTIAADVEGESITLTVTVPATVAGTGGTLTLTPVDYLA